MNKVEEKWKDLVDNDPTKLFYRLNRDYDGMMHIAHKFEDDNGFRLVKENHKIGMKMYLQKNEGDRLVTLKFSVDKVKIPIFNLLSLCYETDLYDLWFPFCKASFDYMRLNKASKICFQELFMPFPLSNRENIMFGYGANRIYHNGTLLVIAKSLCLVDCPLIKEQVGVFHSDRRKQGLVECIVHFYGFEISPISADEVSLRVVMHVDPQISVIPDSLINFATKQLGEEMVNKMLKFGRDFKGTQYEQRLKDSKNADFYHWMKGYIIKYCDERGWPVNIPDF